MNNIAIIPARGGSKRIPRKNIKDFLGKPIISYSIQAALQSNLFQEVMVSTDDSEIATIAKQYGASVPFMRSKRNADDFATTLSVIKEVVECYQNIDRSFRNGCCIYPGAPFVTPSILLDAYNHLLDDNLDVVLPVVPYSYPIWRSLKMESNKVSMWWPENLNKRSQDLPLSYHDAGQFYWFYLENIMNEESLFNNNTGAVIVDELQVHDIDTLQDWEIAEFKYKHLQAQMTNE